ncbi:ribosomal protein S6 [Peptoanaerobacter stomatis]|uniref:Small ribosomal subunit protein bS6 n=1 Tax=Peptoanaerobacter stomatis TaxID=796937 RepID=J6HLT3_9FIRM|nr:30S ribosomal protein S6 [Peptoanaerobacter stomatis]EHL17591.1 ribosomal protein S6 [Peptoanaerobacter stomatis]EJU23433.1 ribosomal protein S6 [Peptoanaerobacter stomatis]NWO24342.1 30S ribosomal protein S6 [Peptostreptococcaceae bacterium oral taxon 081]
MKKYELVYILRTDTDDETKQKIQDKLKGIIDTNGEVEAVDVWGNRKLAYQIQKLSDGYYVLVKFNAGAEVPKELDRNLKIMDQVIRHMIINITDNK